MHRLRKTLLLGFVLTMIAPANAFATGPIPSPPRGDTSSSQNVLHVQLEGFRSNNGKAHCTLFGSQSPDAFPRDTKRALKEAETTSIKSSNAIVDFTGIAPGKYAIVCYHDENSNGKFDMNMIGMPKEGYCFSNSVKPIFSAPNFDECSFDYKGGEQSVSTTMIY
jgi:uncharacterized protein (DUF2141 family)